jgi:hypothetical protein
MWWSCEDGGAAWQAACGPGSWEQPGAQGEMDGREAAPMQRRASESEAVGQGVKRRGPGGRVASAGARAAKRAGRGEKCTRVVRRVVVARWRDAGGAGQGVAPVRRAVEGRRGNEGRPECPGGGIGGRWLPGWGHQGQEREPEGGRTRAQGGPGRTLARKEEQEATRTVR